MLTRVQSMLRHFSKVGRKNTIESSRLYVVECEVNEKDYLDMVKSDMKKITLVPSTNRKKKYLVDFN